MRYGPLTSDHAAPARAVDVLRCDGGDQHDVRMEFVAVSGVRLGSMAAYCYTCRRWVPRPPITPPPTPAAIAARRQRARLAAATLKNDAQARREYIKRQMALGDTQSAIAKQLGITKQRVHAIISGPGRRTA